MKPKALSAMSLKKTHDPRSATLPGQGAGVQAMSLPEGLSTSVASLPLTGDVFFLEETSSPNELLAVEPNHLEVEPTTDEINENDLFNELSELIEQEAPQHQAQQQQLIPTSNNEFFVNTPMVVDPNTPPTPVEKKGQHEVITEVTLPVTTFEDLFANQCAPATFNPDPMMAVNPMEIEGVMPAMASPEHVLPDLLATNSEPVQEVVTRVEIPNSNVVQETQYFIVTSDPPAPAPVAVAAYVAPPERKRRKILPKLVMPGTSQPQPTQLNPVGLDTPAIEAVMAKNASEANFDLLAFVTNETLDPTDPSFLSLVGDTSPSTSAGLFLEDSKDGIETVDSDDLYQPGPSKGKRRLTAKEKKGKSSRPRGRPPSATVTSVASKVTDYDSTSAMSGEDVKQAKYRRMRDLNNEASKRCRKNRKRKFAKIEEEEEDLMSQNQELKAKCRQLEDLVGQLKRKFIEKVANPRKEPLDLNVLMKQKLQSGGV